MIIQQLEKTINVKIVYFGPALSGKTTSIRSLFSRYGKENKIHSIESTIDRTLFFDYGTITFQNQKWDLKAHIYTATGQDFYCITRPITLKAADGIIFVIDSQEEAYDRNLISWKELITYFEGSFFELPIILAFNKQDEENKFNSIDFLRQIRISNFKYIDSRYTIAITGQGIFESFEDIIKLIIKKETNLNKENNPKPLLIEN